MAMAPNNTYIQWTLDGQNGIESLISGKAEQPTELGEYEVLVKIHAASLNYRDLVIAQVWFPTAYRPLAMCTFSQTNENRENNQRVKLTLLGSKRASDNSKCRAWL
jgi:hypothetical protein